MLGSPLCLSGFLQVLLQLVGLLGPARQGGAVTPAEGEETGPFPRSAPGEEGPGLIPRMAPDQTNKVEGRRDMDTKPGLHAKDSFPGTVYVNW